MILNRHLKPKYILNFIPLKDRSVKGEDKGKQKTRIIKTPEEIEDSYMEGKNLPVVF